jgi:hypothetical protein
VRYASGGLVVIVLAIGPKVRGFKAGEGQWICKGDKIRSINFFGREVKAAVPRRKILWHVKNPYCMKEIFVGKIHGHFSASFSCY